MLEIEPGAAGVIMLNDRPFAVFGTGGFRRRLGTGMSDSIRSGKNRIVVLPLEHIEEAGIDVAVSIHEIVETFVERASWRVRRWESAPDTRIGHWNGVPRRRGDAQPHWVRGTVTAPKRDDVSVSVRLEGLTRGGPGQRRRFGGCQRRPSVEGEDVPSRPRSSCPARSSRSTID